MKRYERQANWVFGMALLVLAPVMILMVIYQHRFDPYLTGLFGVTIGLLMVSRVYLRLAPDLKLTESAKREWLLKAVRFYREIGFFSEFGDLTEDKLASKLNSHYRKRMGRSLDPSGRIPDLTLLEFDKSRLWLSDLECDVMSGNDVYVEVIKRLGETSRGSFNPTDITETWDSDKGPIRVEFTNAGVRHALTPKYRNDWVDTDFIFSVARLLQDSEYKLAVHPGDPIAATFLTAAERDRIKKERGLFFGISRR